MKADYYSLLEAWPSSSIDDIKKNYFRLAKIYHPDTAGDTAENRDRFKLINEAYGILSNSQQRHLYDESLRKGKHNTKAAQTLKEEDKRSANLAFMQAKDAMRNGNYEKAALLLKSAVKYDNKNPSYQSYYGFCLAMLNSNLHEARDACKKAVQTEFFNPEYHANLGFVYFKAGLKSLAIKHFQEALKWDPENRIAKKFISVGGGGDQDETGPIDKMFGAIKKVLSKI
ncbi:MAG: DnaJ domain-containing protein [Candidatus Krumholzibacteria bacterium]|nr:DnaJ domain-containing protein [Candidatus Krumholzibacteria bacterium]